MDDVVDVVDVALDRGGAPGNAMAPRNVRRVDCADPNRWSTWIVPVLLSFTEFYEPAALIKPEMNISGIFGDSVIIFDSFTADSW